MRTVVAAPEVPVPGYPRLSAGSPSVYARPSLGAAAVVPLAVPVTEEELGEHLGPGWDPSRTAAVVGLGRADVVRGGPGTVTGGPTGAGSERWRVDAPAGGFLRVGSNWDEGWSARIDGRRAPVLRADGVFRGVVVPAGVHEVRFSFSSRAEVRGRLVALLALPLILALAFVPARRRTWWDRASGAARGFAASPFPFPASDGGGGRRTRVAPFVHLASLAVGLVGLLWANRNQWFFGDEWEFLGGRGLVGGHPGLFSPHNEHWSTPPILVYRALYSLFGVRSYLPYVIVLAAVHLVAAHLLWRVMRRSGADAAVATALAAVFVFLGAGSENILWAFQIGFIGSVACGLGAILLVDHEGPFGGRDVAGWAVLVVGLMCSGIGVPMVAVAAVTVLLRQGRRQGVAGRSDTGRRPFDRLGLGRLGLGRLGLGRLGLGRLGLGRLGWGRAALTVSVPAAVYVVWLRLAGREGLGGRSYDQLSKLSSYVWTGVSNALASTVGSTLMAVLVLAGVVAWMVWRRHLAVSRAAPAFACALGVALLFVVFALGRAGLGTAQAKASRYVYLAIALVLPVVGLMLTDLAARGRAIRAAVLTLVAVVMVYNAALLGDHARVEAVRERRVKGTLLAAADMAVRGEPMVGAVPDPTYDPDVTIDILRRMQRDGKLPSLDYDPADRMAAAAFLQLHVDNHPILGAVPPRLAPLTADMVTEAPGTAPGCVVLIPQAPRPDVVLELDGPLSVTVRSSNGGTLEVTLEEAGPPPIAAAARTFRLDPDAIGYVNVVADIDRVVVGIPGAGTTEVCGL